MRRCAAKAQILSKCRIRHSSQSAYFDAVALFLRPIGSYEQRPSPSTREERLADEFVSGQSTGCWSAQGLHKGKNSTLSFQSSGVLHSITTISSSIALPMGHVGVHQKYPGHSKTSAHAIVG